MNINELKEKILNGYLMSKEEGYELVNADLEELRKAADEIREHFTKEQFDLCSIINAKSGKCSEDCKYCAQSSYYKTNVEEYDLLDSDTIVKEALNNYNKGVLRFSIVTSGRKPTQSDLQKICKIAAEIRKKCDIKVCVSLGLLDENDLKKLKEAGVVRIHNNLESSRNYFRTVCTTHTTDDKIKTLKAAQKLGLDVCSGGILGLGENWFDRVDLAHTLQELGVQSIPVNFLCAIEGTPYENNKKLTQDEIIRICAIFRFINPKAFIRLAGGRSLTGDNGRLALQSGINSLITGDMLTTTGSSIKDDIKMTHELNFEVRL